MNLPPDAIAQLSKVLFPATMTNPTIYIDRPGTQGIEVEVEGTYQRGHRGYRDRTGAQIDPDEPETVEDITAKVVTEAYGDDGHAEPTFNIGDVIELTDKEQDEAAIAIIEAMAKDEPDDDYED